MPAAAVPRRAERLHTAFSEEDKYHALAHQPDVRLCISSLPLVPLWDANGAMVWQMSRAWPATRATQCGPGAIGTLVPPPRGTSERSVTPIAHHIAKDLHDAALRDSTA